MLQNPSTNKVDDSNAKLIARLIADLLAGVLITVALHFSFSFTWLQSFVLMWLYAMLKSEVEAIHKSLKK